MQYSNVSRSDTETSVPSSRQPKINKRLAIQLALLVGFVWLIYAPALDSFFVADDIWQVNFAHKVLDDGRAELIWRNFVSQYLQLPSFDFYRPLLGFTFLFDYALYRLNAVGYHTTSLAIYTASILLFYLLLRTLTRSWPGFNSSWMALLATVLFAVNPLHCEDVSWLSGRADLLAAPFYLLALYLVVRGHIEKRRSFYLLATPVFWLALMSKEISIGLPIVVAAYYYLFPARESFGKIVEKDFAPPDSSGESAKQEKSKIPKTWKELKELGRQNAAEPVPQASSRQIAHAQRALKKKKKGKGKVKAAQAGASATGDRDQSVSENSNDIDQERNDSTASDTAASEAGASSTDSLSAEQGELSSSGSGAGSGDVNSLTRAQRFLMALKYSSPFIVSGLIYLGIRYAALGSVVGGYSGMMGGALDRHVFLRWIDPVNLVRIMLPFPESITPSSLLPHWIVGLSLVMCLFIGLLRLVARSSPLRWLLFLFAWMFTAIAPLAKLWGVGLDLETSRLLFFFTMGYSALWPVLMLYPPKAGTSYELPATANRSLVYVSGFVVFVMAATMSWATMETNVLWYKAGHELRKIWTDTVALVNDLKGDEKVIVLGIPKDYKGAHVNFNGSTFHHMLRPPWTETPLSPRVITFEPFIIGPFEVINTTRFKTFLEDPTVKGPYVWKRATNRFESIRFGGRTNLPETLVLPFQPVKEGPVAGAAWRFSGKGTTKAIPEGIVMHDTVDGDALMIDGLSLSPKEYDFIEFEIDAALSPSDFRKLVPMAIGWNNLSVDTKRTDWVVEALNVPKLHGVNKFRLQLSHYWNWYAVGEVKSIVMRLFGADTIEIKNVRLLKGTRLIPFITLLNREPLSSGEYVLKDESALNLIFESRQIDGAAAAEIEVTRPNYFFDNYLMGSGETPTARRLVVKMPHGITPLDSKKLFPIPAYYEIRLRALDLDNRPVGVWSDAITVVKMGDGLDTYNQ